MRHVRYFTITNMNYLTIQCIVKLFIRIYAEMRREIRDTRRRTRVAAPATRFVLLVPKAAARAGAGGGRPETDEAAPAVDSAGPTSRCAT